MFQLNFHYTLADVLFSFSILCSVFGIFFIAGLLKKIIKLIKPIKNNLKEKYNSESDCRDDFVGGNEIMNIPRCHNCNSNCRNVIANRPGYNDHRRATKLSEINIDKF